MDKRRKYRTKPLVQSELELLEYEIRLHLERYERLRGIVAVHKFITKLINQRYEVSKNLETNNKSAK